MPQQPTAHEYSQDYDEISLREVIEVLINRKKLIAVITVIAILVAGVFSYFIIDPTYEAKTILMASFATDKLTNLNSNTGDVESMLDSISTYPVLTIQTYTEQIKSPEILQQTIDELELDKLDIKRNSLANMINLETIKDTNLIAVKVKCSDPELASDIANTLAKNFTNFITKVSKDRASRSSQFLKNQLEVEKSKLDEALLELKTFLSQPRGLDELKSEYTSKIELLTNYKTQLVEKEVEVNKLEAGLATAKKDLEDTPEILVTKKSVGEDSLLNQVVSDKTDSTVAETADITMENQEVNPNYIGLKKQISCFNVDISQTKKEIEVLGQKIDKTQKELENLNAEIAEKDHQHKLIQRNMSLAQSTYDAFLNKYEETRIAESTEIGESSINIVSKAAIPQVPVAPRKALNVAIAAVLGIMVGVFIAFFKEYWKNSAA